MQIDISFVVPVYNVSKYLSQCVESIIMQKNIKKEIILVNDGSTDDSLDICNKLATKCKDIIVINKKNEGVSEARNVGIKNANGKYICFMDSDDYYCEDFAYDFLNLCIKYDLDIIRGFYKIYDEEKNEVYENEKNIEYQNIVLYGEKFLMNSIKSNSSEVVPWLGFFKRDFLLENNLFFPKGIAYEEDQLFFLKALLGKQTRIMQTDRYFYMYMQRKGSCTAHPKISNIEDACYITNEEIKFINSLNLEKEIQNAAYIYASWSFFQVTTLYGRLRRDEQKRVYPKIYKKVINHSITYSPNYKIKFKIILLKYFPYLYSLIFKLLRKEYYK